jgi:hypothetical protein
MTTQSTGNPFNELVTNMINMQLASIQTQETVSNSNKILTDANQALSGNWTSCPESNPNDPGYVAYYYLMGLNNGTYPPTAPTESQLTAYGLPANFKQPANISAWVTTFLGAPGVSLDNFSSVFMTQVYNVYEQNPPSGNDPATLGLISNITNLLQASAQSDLQTGQNGITLLNNLAQHFVSDQGPLSSATSTIIDGVNNYSTAMSQITA